MPNDKRELTLRIKLNKVILNKTLENKIVALIDPQVDITIITMHDKLANIFNLPKSAKLKTMLSLFRKLSQEEQDFISVLRLNKSFKIEHINSIIDEYFTRQISVKNAAFYYQFASQLNYTKLAVESFKYIERCFLMVVETNSFLELDYESVANILDSSELRIRTEIEVLEAAATWLSHNIEERSKFARELLLTVRLSLLSDYALADFFQKFSSFSTNLECVELLKQVLLVLLKENEEH